MPGDEDRDESRSSAAHPGGDAATFAMEIAVSVSKLMVEQNVTRGELARRVKQPLRDIAELLGGSGTTKLSLVAAVFWALNSEFVLNMKPIRPEGGLRAKRRRSRRS